MSFITGRFNIQTFAIISEGCFYESKSLNTEMTLKEILLHVLYLDILKWL